MYQCTFYKYCGESTNCLRLLSLTAGSSMTLVVYKLIMADKHGRYYWWNLFIVIGNFVPNLTVELYFVVQLLTTRSTESPTRTPERGTFSGLKLNFSEISSHTHQLHYIPKHHFI